MTDWHPDPSKEYLAAYTRQVIDCLGRRGLLLFLDKERSKENTKRLRARAHRVVDDHSTTMFILDDALRARTLENEPS